MVKTDNAASYLSLIHIFQTDKPLKRAFMPYGGIKMAVQAAETYGYNVSDKLKAVSYTHLDVYKRQGCDIGSRPIDLHMKGFRSMGADIDIAHGLVIASAKEAMYYGFALITEERKANGLFLKGDVYKRQVSYRLR